MANSIHIPEGILNPYTCIIMYIVAAVFLVWSWRGIKKTMPRSVIPLIAIVSALLLVVQLFEPPVAGGGSTWHFLGGTTVSLVLGPYAAVVSMTITLIIQMMIGDGGITSFGANIFNMAVIGSLSFFIVKALLSRKFTTKRLALAVFAASCIANICTALAVGLEIGIYPIAGNLGGPLVTVSTMLIWYVPTGIIEGVVASVLIVSLAKIKPLTLFGLESCINDQSKLKSNS
jgi:cobalt/nickel transport system permease protein